MVAGSDLPPSVAGAIGLPRVAPTREFLAIMRDLWRKVYGPATTISADDAPAAYSQVQVQGLVDAIKELQAIHNGD